MRARVGDTIEWGSETFLVGYGHDLERVIDGLREHQWIEAQLNRRYIQLEDVVRGKVSRGEMTPEDAEDALRECKEAISREAETMYGDPIADLTDYSEQM